MNIHDVYLNCGDASNTWASQLDDAQREYLVLSYATPQPIHNIVIYQTFNPGAIDTVYVRNASEGTWNTIYTATAAPVTTCPLLLNIQMPVTSYSVDAVRIALNSPLVAGYNEIDAVGIANATNYFLPVQLLSFTVEKLNQDVQLQWLTATEKMHHYSTWKEA